MRPRDLHRYLNDVGWTLNEIPAPGPPEGKPVPAATNLESLSAAASECEACRLSEDRRTVVFGEGDANARVLFVGEGPGRNEDRTGRPFVGRAGELLDSMIFAMGFERSETYITNIVKCRPPGNRDPQSDEVAACSAFLDRQIDLIKPTLIVALGKPAAHRLTGTAKPIGALRGRWAAYRGIPLMPVFHPAYLLRQPKLKREAWEDLKAIKAKLDTNA